MKHTICKEFGFEASHCLDHLPEGHKCRQVHGHSYKVQVVVGAPDLDENGFVIDYAKFAVVGKKIDDELDHKHLNNVMGGLKPTAELIAKMIHGWVYDLIICDETVREDLVIVAVRVSETGKTWAEYRN